MKHKNALILFIKNPVAGKVKTRLAATMGHDAALQIYLRLLERTRLTALQTDAVRMVFYSDFIDTTDAWHVPEFQKKLQRGADLGMRMHHALEDALAEHEKAVLVGGDIPALSPAVIEDAFAELEHCDVVFGPATDGGYYLVGMRRPHIEIFTALEWSTPRVLEESVARCRQLGLNHQLVATLQDVDTEEDWNSSGLSPF